ncbi:hypothetical protein HYH03_002547 [Edaphochlamys debaryana]|uniref:PPPDE domain-containing protein n=1 Tax=Edaphochlamys debaryana TaxID=47281 RepID=A0A835YBJ6_9CHLO|nr:hypothetical protein HYH03_002547 [Edaphochlamys debaryana]|eukprot:KAG2499606.1 hypothetical protein HYH03_002547 [Edaphochlamys debaryana]
MGSAAAPHALRVALNVYDVTNLGNEQQNTYITRLNSITRELNLGGVFHGAVEIDGEVEYSFGYCESGTGVYACRARQNSLYTYRENIPLGEAHKTKQELKEIISRFKRSWPGTSYDLLTRNCCHFCEELCAVLEVPPPPPWLNRFAAGADAVSRASAEASALARRVSSNLSLTAQSSASWLREVSSRVFTNTGAGGDPDGEARGDAEVAEASRGSEFSASMSRLASRLRMLAGPSVSPGSAPASGSASPGYPRDSSGSVAGSGVSFPAALRAKWQELEASAGDGTKQFLFGLIKTRSRLDEEDLYGNGGTGGLGGGNSPFGASDAAGPSVAPPRPQPPMGVNAPPTQPPMPQVISHTLLPPDVVGDPDSVLAPGAAVAGGVLPTSSSAAHLLDM